MRDMGETTPKPKKPRISEEPSPSTSEDHAMLEMTETNVKVEEDYEQGMEEVTDFGDHGAWQIEENGCENQENSFVRKCGRAPSTPNTKGNQANREKIAACVLKLSAQEFVCRLCEHKTNIKQSLENKSHYQNIVANILS